MQDSQSSHLLSLKIPPTNVFTVGRDELPRSLLDDNPSQEEKQKLNISMSFHASYLHRVAQIAVALCRCRL